MNPELEAGIFVVLIGMALVQLLTIGITALHRYWSEHRADSGDEEES